MNLLVDTNVLLWWLDDSPALSAEARELISDGDSVTVVSAVTIWEIVVKSALGKLDVPENIEEHISQAGFTFLDLTPAHAWEVGHLPAIHRDPFDRMLVAQSRIEKLTLVTRDENIPKYGVPVIKA